MADETDTFYDHVDARRGGSLVEEEIPEFICNEFFKTHSDVETITLAVPKVKTSVENENERATQSSASEPLQRELCAAPQVVHKVVSSSESGVPQHPVQDENILQEPAETKPAADLEDLSRLAMFGKQRKVLRRSQIRPEPGAAAAAPSPASNTLSSRRSTQRETPRSRLHPTPVNSVRSSGTQRDDTMFNARARLTPSSIREKRTAATRPTTRLGKNKPGPVRVLPESKQEAIPGFGATSQPADAEAGSVTRQTSDVPQGPLTRARSKELGLSAETGTTERADAVSSATVASLATGVRQMRVGAERVARDRAPRTTTSSASVVRVQRADPVRIGQRPQGGDFLRNAAVPSEREFRRELVNRVSSLGPNPRGSTSTPKDGEKAPSSVSSSTTNKDQRPPSSRGAAPVGRSLSATRPVSNGPRPGVVARSSSSRPVNRPTVRPPSVTRPLYPTTLARPPSVTRPQSAASVKHPASRTGSVTRTTHRPPSVTRPTIPDKPSNQQISSRTGVVNSTRRSAARAPVTVTAAARSIVSGKGTPLRNSVHRNEQVQPLEPRSSVIRCTPVNPVGRGNGTPLRGFRSELRRYPAPTGLTPSHRAPTIPKGFGLHGKSACANGPNKTASTTSSMGPSPMKTLSKEEERAMVNRLAVPKKIAMKTPSKVSNLQTHGLSCVKLRSRSTSVARHPPSAVRNNDVPSSCRMLTYSGTDRPMSAEPSTQTEPATAQETTTVE